MTFSCVQAATVRSKSVLAVPWVLPHWSPRDTSSGCTVRRNPRGGTSGSAGLGSCGPNASLGGARPGACRTTAHAFDIAAYCRHDLPVRRRLNSTGSPWREDIDRRTVGQALPV